MLFLLKFLILSKIFCKIGKNNNNNKKKNKHSKFQKFRILEFRKSKNIHIYR